MADTSRREQRAKGKPWPKGTSGNPKGRPKGSGTAGELREVIAAHAPAIVEALVREALAGDVQAARVLLDRVLPTLRAESLAANLPGLGTGTLTQRAESALAAAAAGDVAPDAAAALVAAVVALARVKETDELEARIRVLEGRNA